MATFRLRGALKFALILMALLFTASAGAQTFLVDTGQPTGTSSLSLCATSCGGGATFQNLAGTFTLTQAYSISSVQAWIQAPGTAGQLAVVIRADSAGSPGASVFSQTYSVPNQTTSGWVVFTFTNQPLLTANTPYWLSFEPVVGSPLLYNMTEFAPHPLANYSVYNSKNSGPFISLPNPGFGMRISGTPAAGPSLLVDTGAGQGGSLVIGSNDLFNSSGNFENIAGQFTLNQAATITSIQGWMQIVNSGSMNVKIYAGNSTLALAGIIPGASISSQTFTPGATTAEGWVAFPLSLPYPTLPAGTYWVSFEPIPGPFNAEMTAGVATPLANYAYYVNGNNRWVNFPLNVGFEVFGTAVPPATYGTAARTIMTGSAFGLPNTPQDIISGGDGLVDTSPWNFIIPSGWSFARGTIIQNGLLAGAYSATSGPCSGIGSVTCGIGAGRGVAYRTWNNITSQTLVFQVNAVLNGEFQNSGGVATAGIYVFDATAFSNAVTASGLATPQFLLNGSTLAALSAGGTSLAGLFPNSGVILNHFQTVTGPANQLLTIPLTSQFITVAPQQAITVMFDVSAYAPGFGSANFASTLEPSPTLPLFTDASGNAVTQLVAAGPSVTPAATPSSLVLTPATASNPVGSTVSITATVTDSGGLPVPNSLVFFAFNSGPNMGPAGPVSTDTNGQAVFTYTDNGGAGTDVIQATLGALTATPVSITWTAPGPLDHIAISPATVTIAAGGSQSYTAAGFDRFNNSIGDVTAQTTFGITPDGSCIGGSCTASVSGPHTVTGNDGGKTAQASLTIGSLQTPMITWVTPAAITYGTPLSATQLSATANVGGIFAYTPGSLAVLNAGIQTLSVLFTPFDPASYTTASATVNLQVNKATPLITWLTPAPITAGTALSSTQLDASANVDGSFLYTPDFGAIPSAGSPTLAVSFTPKDTANYAGATAQVTLVVNLAGATPFVTGQTLGPVRNNYTGFVGFSFTTGATPTTVYSLGRFILAGNTQSHLLKLVQANGADVPNASVTIDTSTGTPGTYQYAALSNPVTLLANTSYFLVSMETANGDQWYDFGPVSTAPIATVNGPAYTDFANHYVAATVLPGQSFVPLNFLYAPPTTSLSVSITSPAPNAIISGSASITVSTTGPVASLQVQVDGVNEGSPVPVSMNQGPSYTLSLDTTVLRIGAHSLTVTANGVATSPTVSVTISNSPGGSTAFVLGQTPGPLRNNYTGFVGFAFHTGSTPVVVASLGRFAAPNNSDTHVLKLVNSDGTDVPGGSVAISMVGSTPGTFQYATLSAGPFTLQANTTYYLVSHEVSGGDAWYDYGPVATTIVASVTGPAYTDGFGHYITGGGLGGESYVPLSFLYGPTANTLSATITSPQNGALLSGSVPVTVSATGAVSSYQLQVDGVNAAPASPSSPITLDTTLLSNGQHTLSVVVSESGIASVVSPGVTVTVNNAASTLTAFTTGQSARPLRNNYTGFVGTTIQVGPNPLPVLTLGRFVVSGNSRTHLLKLVQATGIDVPGGSVMLSLQGAPAGQYAYAALPATVTLQANTTYYLVSQETAGGDQWFDLEPITTTGVASVTGPTYTDGQGHYITPAGFPGYSYVPLGFQYGAVNAPN